MTPTSTLLGFFSITRAERIPIVVNNTIRNKLFLLNIENLSGCILIEIALSCTKAIVFDNLNPFVWIIMENQKIRKQEIQVGRQLGEYVEVLSGLERGFGYLVILDPTVSLESGQSITSLTSAKVGTSTRANVSDESQPHEH